MLTPHSRSWRRRWPRDAVADSKVADGTAKGFACMLGDSEIDRLIGELKKMKAGGLSRHSLITSSSPVIATFLRMPASNSRFR